MFTLHISHQVTDYDAWKTAFDAYDQVRRDNGVLAYRIARGEPGGNTLHIDLDFGTRDQARAFATVLDGIWRSPRAVAVLAGDRTAEVRDLVERQTLA
ncbi:hypothetical protein ACWELJ_00100 [Nocardia sp. NPDC004582]